MRSRSFLGIHLFDTVDERNMTKILQYIVDRYSFSKVSKIMFLHPTYLPEFSLPSTLQSSSLGTAHRFNLFFVTGSQLKKIKHDQDQQEYNVQGYSSVQGQPGRDLLWNLCFLQ